MRLVIQRVQSASVEIEGAVTAKIGPGMLILIGIEQIDTKEDALWLSKKISSLRIFPDADDKMNIDIHQSGGSVLVVSQFTLHANTKKGNRPSYIRAAAPEHAIPLYDYFIEQLRANGLQVETGMFGAMMQVKLVNDGPVTIFMDSKSKE